MARLSPTLESLTPVSLTLVTLTLVLLTLAPVPARAQSPPAAQRPSDRPIVIGSKPFGESYLLAEMFAQQLEARGHAVTRRPGLGGTEILFPALVRGDIDVYPEYTGSGLRVILKQDARRAGADVFDTVSRTFASTYDVRWLPPLGFENTYAMSVRTEMAERLGLRTLSDAARVSGTLRAGFTADFIGQVDGLPALREAYGLDPREVNALAPAVKYQALASGAVDIIDAYSTDGLLARYPLTVLEDDRRVFPPYDAAALVRGAIARARPAAVVALVELSGRLDVQRMRRLNERVEVNGEPVAHVAADALRDLGLVAQGAAPGALGPDHTSRANGGVLAYLYAERWNLWRMTGRHLMLVLISLGLAVLTGVALGLSLDRARFAEPVIRTVGVLQTIPGLALLAFTIPVLGIGVLPAVAALFLYSLYPIVRNTFTGIRGADAGAVAAARALGMTPGQVLRLVRLPLAAPFIVAGVRTAAVVNVGTATLAALVGAGGLGDPIVAGLALADTRMILSGAVPAALLALLVDAALGWVQARVTPAGPRGEG
jgi:osmoprotectant transport system permease protein